MDDSLLASAAPIRMSPQEYAQQPLLPLPDPAVATGEEAASLAATARDADDKDNGDKLTMDNKTIFPTNPGAGGMSREQHHPQQT